MEVISRAEAYLNYALKNQENYPEPISRMDYYLLSVAQEVRAGGADPATITTAVNDYLAANPVQAMTDEQIATSVNKSINDGSINVMSEVEDGSITESKLSDDVKSTIPNYPYNGSLYGGGWCYVPFLFDLGEEIDSPTLTLKTIIKSINADKDIVNFRVLGYSTSNNNSTYSSITNAVQDTSDIELNREKVFTISTTGTFRYIKLFLYFNTYGIDITTSSICFSRINLYNGESLVKPLYNTVDFEEDKLVPYKLLEDKVKELNDKTIGRYQFDEDLLNDEPDNYRIYEVSTFNGWAEFGRTFDLGKTVDLSSSQKVKLELIISELVSESKEINNYKEIRYGFTDTIGVAPQYSNYKISDTTLALKDEKIIEFTVTPTGRYMNIQIGFNAWQPTDVKIVFDKMKLYLDGTYKECVDKNQNYSDNKIINYGILQNEINKANEYEGKVIALLGDSLTAGGNGATNDYPSYVGKIFQKAIVKNCGSSGGGTARLVKCVSNSRILRGDNTYIKPLTDEDYKNLIAVTINIGTNGGVSGDITTSIPQLTNQTVDDALVDGGFTYNETIIDSEEKYWDLFSNDWYGNICLVIEYIRWRNPMTQIFLVPPAINDVSSEKSNSPESIMEAMKKVANEYGIAIIDTISGLGISRRNSDLYRVDYTHGTNLRNEMYGYFVGHQILSKLACNKYIDDTEYAVSEIVFNKETEAVTTSATVPLYLTIAPYNATNKNITISSDNENVTIELSEKGLYMNRYIVTGVTAGTSIITATSEDGSYTATCTVTVTE